jgi:hypothetical protein
LLSLILLLKIQIKVREIDFSEWVADFKASANGWTSKLADPGYFITAKVADYGTLVWGDDIDFDK